MALAAREPVIAELLATVGPCVIPRPRSGRSHFAELTRMVCYQQLAGVAAAAIHGRLVLALESSVTPEHVMEVPEERLRGAGLSRAKVATIRDLAQRALSGEVRLATIARYEDDEVVRQLTQVRGIGPWTAEMFLMFRLGRLDVWPVGDYGVRQGSAVILGLAAAPTPRELTELGERFRPYRSVAAWYCWRALDAVAGG
jgi:3-methyladenine DNA glycosylase/8-oxoguanine DNA glycosylase